MIDSERGAKAKGDDGVVSITEGVQGFMDDFVGEERVEFALTPSERKHLIGTGVKKYGLIDKAYDIVRDNPDFLPGFLSVDDMRDNMRDFEETRQLVFVLRKFMQVATDHMMVKGDKCFRDALRVYNTLQEMSRGCVPGATPLFESLKPFFAHRRKAERDVPTAKQLERDFHGLLRGTREGTVVVENESPHMEGGKRVVVDEVV